MSFFSRDMTLDQKIYFVALKILKVCFVDKKVNIVQSIVSFSTFTWRLASLLFIEFAKLM